MKRSCAKPNFITYNMITVARGKGGVDLKKMLDIFDEMQREGVEPNQITLNSFIVVCNQGSF